MDLNEFDDNEGFEEEANSQDPSEEGSSNRGFIIGVGILGAVVVLAIIGFIIYILLSGPKTSTDLQNQAAVINAQNTAISLYATQTVAVEQSMATQKALPTFTSAAPTNTAVVAVASPTPTDSVVSTPGAGGGTDPAARTATVAAFQTQAAAAVLGTGTPAATQLAQLTPTQLPTTGFADEVGLPMLFGAALILILVIVMARRLRYSAK